MSHSLPKKIQTVLRGFTIVELLVTLSIVVLVTGLIMIRYAAFNSSVLLNSQAYIVAFDLRETQSLAVSVRGRAGEFREEYGMYFSMDTDGQYILFQDDDSNGVHSPVRYTASEAVGEPKFVDPRFAIVNICLNTASSRTCYTDDPKTSGEVIDGDISEVTISFQRPDFDAGFYTPGVSGIRSVEIIFGPVTDDEFQRKVVVYSTGQIVVE